jgi:prevent-host-death family protein
MKFSTDELMSFSEVRTGMSHYLVDVQAGKEIVITRHGKPKAALISAAQLFRYREIERLISEFFPLSQTDLSSSMLLDALIQLQQQIDQLPTNQEEHKS